jgi:co-chaperonin GroES (HSP10)
MMKLNPSDDRIIAVPTKPKEKTDSGFYLSEASKVQMPTATVIAVGKHIAKISEGDVIVYASGGFGKDSTVEQVEIGKDKYVFLKEGDVLAKVEEK